MGKDLPSQITTRIKQLEEKYDAMGQDLSSYLDGLLHTDYLTYWDYIHLDTLLTLQTPKTNFPDEQIFILYHQITELYFKMILWEIDQITDRKPLTEEHYLEGISRINRYFENLTSSFTIMVDGLRKKEFLAFRMALLPSSGFQSVQYRLIEISATDMINLVAPDLRPKIGLETDVKILFENIYWKTGATELATGKKTLTLAQFEAKYASTLTKRAGDYKAKNLWQCFLKLSDLNGDGRLEEALRKFDLLANVDWPLAHFKSAVRHLEKDPKDIAATGGTNWQKYLPPRFQKVVFFPDLWDKDELESWGRSWVAKEVFDQ